MAVGVDRGEDRHGRGDKRGDIVDAHGDAAGGGLDDEVAERFDIMRLRADQAEDELVVCLVQAGRIDDVRSLDCVDEIKRGNAGCLQFSGVRNDVELRHLAALHDDRGDAATRLSCGFRS